MQRPTPDPTAQGQESVWAYPRPAAAEPTARLVRVEHRGVTVAETRHAIRTLETSHPPTYYIPRDDIMVGVLRASGRRSLCEWKGQAVYFDIFIAGDVLRKAAWSCPAPTIAFESLRGTSRSTPTASIPAQSVGSARFRSPATSTAAGSPPGRRARTKASQAAASGKRQQRSSSWLQKHDIQHGPTIL